MISKILRRLCCSLNHKYFKLSEEDILSIIKDYVIEQLGTDTSQVKLKLVAAPEGGVNLVAAVGNIEDDSLAQVDLQEIGNQIDYNGPVSSLSDSFLVNPGSSETKELIQKLLEKLQDE